ncbi:MAG: hypothetical protein LBK55_02790 [Azoarcus sp.]|nr:hypothetical protein [Azoarcus sp.]
MAQGLQASSSSEPDTASQWEDLRPVLGKRSKCPPCNDIFGLPTKSVDNFVGNSGTAPRKLRHCDGHHALPNHEAEKNMLLINVLFLHG